MNKTELNKITDLFLGNQFLGNQEAQEKKKKQITSSGILLKYQERMKTGEFFNLTFQKVDINGNLFFIDEDVTIQMKADEINGRSYDLRYKSQKLEEVYCVKVVDIEEKSKTILVSQYEACLDKQPEIESEIDRLLKQKGQVTVKARVLRIQSKNTAGTYADIGVWLDLCGVGLLGYVYIGNWNPTFTQTLFGDVLHGDIVEVIVKEKKKRIVKNSNIKDQFFYICSRKELQQNPWEDKSLPEKYKIGDLVRIKCLTTQSQFWFGKVFDLDNIQILVEYPSTRHTFKIIPGMEYMGKIYQINIKEHSLKARVFKSLTLDAILENETEEEPKGDE